MRTIIQQIKSHAEAAKNAQDSINHLDAIIGACGLLEQEIERNGLPMDTVKKLVLERREYHAALAKRIDLNAIAPENIQKQYYERDRLQYTAAVLDELLERIEGTNEH